MSIRALCGVFHTRPAYRTLSFRNPSIAHIDKAMKSTSTVYWEHRRSQEANKTVTESPRRKEYKVVPPKETKIKREEIKAPTLPPPMSFEEFKKERLLTYEEYENQFKDSYAIEKIKRAYERYCLGSYESYLIEHRQINPGIIL